MSDAIAELLPTLSTEIEDDKQPSLLIESLITERTVVAIVLVHESATTIPSTNTNSSIRTKLNHEQIRVLPKVVV